MAQVNVAPLIADSERRWKVAHVKPQFAHVIDAVAQRLTCAGVKRRYQSLQRMTGVPWFIIAVIHEREASQRWDRSIAQGDPWARVSTHVPKGRGPFTSFESAALDALQKCAPYAARWRNWTAGGGLTLLIMYNGLGYWKRGLPSPYDWAATDQYVRGKYVSDGNYDPNVVDTQLGCAALLKRMAEIDPEATFDEDKRVAEKTTSTGTAIGTAAETARQTSDKTDASHVDAAKELVTGGMSVGRVFIIIGIAAVAAVAIYYLIKFVRANRPVVVTDVAREHHVGSEVIAAEEAKTVGA